MRILYKILLNFQCLKCLNVSLTYFIPRIESHFLFPQNLNKQATNLEYLIIDHLVYLSEMISVIRYTPKLRHLYLQKLDGSNNSFKSNKLSMIPKLPQLNKLIVKQSELSPDSMELLVDAFDCQLTTLKICVSVHPDSSLCIDTNWEKFMNTKLSHFIWMFSK